MSSLKDKLWLWGQDPGTHQTVKLWNLPETENKMDAVEGCKFFGVDNCYRIVMANEPAPPYDNAAEEVKHLKNVIWSITGDASSPRTTSKYGELDEVISIAKKYPNIKGGMLDDFFNSPGRPETIKPEDLKTMKENMCSEVGRNMELHMVYYAHLYGDPTIDFKAYFEQCDTVSLWVWSGSSIFRFDEHFDRLRKYAPNAKYAAGLYMWNYGEYRPMTDEEMNFQFKKYEELLKSGDIDSVILCSNAIADLGIKAVDMTKEWVQSLK